MRSLITAAALLVSATLTMGFSAASYEGPPFQSSVPIPSPPADGENGSNGKYRSPSIVLRTASIDLCADGCLCGIVALTQHPEWFGA